MNDKTLKEGVGFLDRAQLVKLRLRAVRSGVWFRALSRIDRVLVDLTIKVAVSVRSAFLARSILSVTRKLEVFLQSRVEHFVRGFGASLAHRLSLFAQSWGNSAARGWAEDQGFARYLGVMKLNGHSLGVV